MARHAAILGHTDDQAKYSALAASVAAAFYKHFYDATAKTFREPNRTCNEYLSVQTLISLAAALDVIPMDDYDAVIDNLIDDVDWHLDVGIVGVKYLLPALSNAGRGDGTSVVPPSGLRPRPQSVTQTFPWHLCTDSSQTRQFSR